jgi:hypothetical protein
MRFFCPIVFFLLLFSSCATLFNTNCTSVKIRAERGIKLLAVDSSIKYSDHKGYMFKRTSDSLRMNVLIDHTEYKIQIPARRSFVYYENILNSGVGFFIDKNSKKQYSYPRHIYIERKDSSFKVSRYPTIKKGTMELSIAFPYINSFHVKTVTWELVWD